MEFKDLLHTRAALTLEKQPALFLEFRTGWASKKSGCCGEKLFCSQLTQCAGSLLSLPRTVGVHAIVPVLVEVDRGSTNEM